MGYVGKRHGLNFSRVEFVQVTVETVEVVMAGTQAEAPPDASDEGEADVEASAAAAAAAAAKEVDRTKPTGWLQSLLRRIVANMSVKVQHLVAKWEGAAATVTLACDEAHLQTVDDRWMAASWQGGRGGLRKALDVRNLTVSMDPRGGLGKRQAQEGGAFASPLLRTTHSRAMANLPLFLNEDDDDDDFNPQDWPFLPAHATGGREARSGGEELERTELHAQLSGLHVQVNQQATRPSHSCTVCYVLAAAHSRDRNCKRFSPSAVLAQPEH
jgi:hypothetical protein